MAVLSGAAVQCRGRFDAFKLLAAFWALAAASFAQPGLALLGFISPAPILMVVLVPLIGTYACRRSWPPQIRVSLAAAVLALVTVYSAALSAAAFAPG